MIPRVSLTGFAALIQRLGSSRCWWGRLFAPVDASSLAVFRIVFGLLMVWETWRIIDNGWVERHFSGKEFYFTYWPLDFLRPWPGDGMYLHLALMGIFAGFVALGFLYRVSAACFFLMFAYVFLLEKARYLNHFYLVCLLSALLAVLPAHRQWSVDSLLWPAIRSPSVPAWSLWLLRFQIAIPMFFAGLAKLNGDWLRGEPLRMWLAARPDFPLLGPYFQDEAVVWAMVYGALAIDLLFIGYITNRRTRAFGFGLVVLFHLLNARMFSIGIFPWLMIAATPVFFAPDWPRRVWDDIRRKSASRVGRLAVGIVAGGMAGWLVPEQPHLMTLLCGAFGVGLFVWGLDEPFRKPGAAYPGVEPEGNRDDEAPVWTLGRRWAVALLGAWVAVQVLLPLRHYAIPGNVHWTEEGRDYSWHMKLRNKESSAYFEVTTGDGTRIVRPEEHLTGWQASKMASRPEMVVQYARYLERLSLDHGEGDVEVRAHVFSALNDRPPQRLVDETVDLTTVARPWWGHASWILPLETPLRTDGDAEAGQDITPTRTLPP